MRGRYLYLSTFSFITGYIPFFLLVSGLLEKDLLAQSPVAGLSFSSFILPPDKVYSSNRDNCFLHWPIFAGIGAAPIQLIDLY